MKTCPIPISDYPIITMAHGSGGKLMQQLIDKMFIATFGREENSHDSFVFEHKGKLAFTTDSYVVKPIFFNGGDIGEIAVNGTINDLAMSGAKPLYISVSFIIEEGFLMEDLWQIVQSIKKSADEAGVKIVTGDTKVVNKGAVDGIFINTSGIGEITHDLNIEPSQIKAGDAIILSNDIGRHGVAIMAEREGLDFEPAIKSDTAQLNKPVLDLINSGVEIHCLRDATRGGVAAVLNEIGQEANLGIEIFEDKIPVLKNIRGACEILGLNPLEIANEGCFVAFVPEKNSAKAIETLEKYDICANASVIGSVSEKHKKIVSIRTSIGGNFILPMPQGELLPRIC